MMADDEDQDWMPVPYRKVPAEPAEPWGVVAAAVALRDAFRYRPEGQSGEIDLFRKIRRVCAAVDEMEATSPPGQISHIARGNQ